MDARKESSKVIVEEVRLLTLFEALTIGPTLVFLIGSAVVLLLVLITQGTETLLQLLGSLADIVGLLSAVPLVLFLGFIGLWWRRWRAEMWIKGHTPVLQRVLLMREEIQPKWFRIPPRWVDFRKHVCRRRKLGELVENLRQNPVTMLHAMSGAGKTTLALHLGYVLLTEQRWRFVIYWDAGSLGFKDPESLIRDVHSRMASLSLSRCKALVIVDNVHLNTDLVGRCARDLVGLFEGNIRCLLVARVTAGSITEDRAKWDRMLGLADAHPDHGREMPCINYFPLEPEDFEQSVRAITESYARDNLPSDEEKRSDILRMLMQKSKQSLVLLRFLLERLGSRVGNVEEVNKVDVTESIRDYYEREVVGRIVEGISPADYGHLEKLVRSVLLCVGIYSRMEIPAYRPLLSRVLASGPADHELVQQIVEHLSVSGDLIGEKDDLLHPHLTIAEALPAVYHDEFEKLHESFEKVIPASVVGFSWPAEYATIAVHLALTEAGHRNKAAQALARLLADQDYVPSAGLLDYFLSRPADFGAGLAMLSPVSWLVFGEATRLLIVSHGVSADKAAPVLAETIQRSDQAWWVIEAVRRSPELGHHSDIVSAIARAIRASDVPWWVIDTISGWTELRQHPDIVAAVQESAPKVAHAIENSDEPWLVIRLISGWTQLRQHSGIMTAVRGSVPKITHAIEESQKPWLVTRAISGWTELREHSDIIAAVRESAPEIAHAIRESDEPWLVISLISEWTVLSHHPEILSAIADAIVNSDRPQWVIEAMSEWTQLRQHSEIVSAIAHSIQESDEPWWFIRIISDWAELREHPDIAAAVRGSVPKVAHAIGNSDEPWAIIEAIGRWTELRQHSDIVAAVRGSVAKVTHAIQESQEPWWFIHIISDWVELREHPDIAAAVRGSVPKTAHAIRESEKPWLVAKAISGLAEMRNQKDIRAALRHSLPAIRGQTSLGIIPEWILELLLRFDIIRDDTDFQEVLKKTGLYERYYGTSHKGQDAAKDSGERFEGSDRQDTMNPSG